MEETDHRQGWLLRPRHNRQRRRAAEDCDELAPFQLIELHSVSHQPGSQDIELAMVSQRERPHMGGP
jgi:hypothetical protein